MSIEQFEGPYGFLSNFYPSELVVRLAPDDGFRSFPSVEHAYQAAKTVFFDEQEMVRTAATPARAKKLGRQVTMRPDWDSAKIDFMRTFLREKFKQDPFRVLLAATGDHVLIEGNWWGDRFWGVYKGSGENHLGKLLMQVRGEIVLAAQESLPK